MASGGITTHAESAVRVAAVTIVGIWLLLPDAERDEFRSMIVDMVSDDTFWESAALGFRLGQAGVEIGDIVKYAEQRYGDG